MFRTVLLQARKPQTIQVTVGGRPVDVVKPFASPADWRDQWIYFLIIDRFNNPAALPVNLPFDQAFGGFQGGTFRGKPPVPDTSEWQITKLCKNHIETLMR